MAPSFKVLLVVVVLTSLAAVSTGSSQACSRWVQLNTDPVCFGARDNSYGSFQYNKNVFVKRFMLVHRSGWVTCDKRLSNTKSFWGCGDHGRLTVSFLNAVITDSSNKVLAPSAAASSPGWYKLPGYTSRSSVLMLCGLYKPVVCVHASEELRLWYGEDLYGSTEADNAGQTCADVYGEIAWVPSSCCRPLMLL